MRFLILILTSVGLFGQVTVVGNMSGTAGAAQSPQSNFWMAQMFTTNDQEYEISSVRFRGARHPSQSNITVYIYADNSGSPAPGATGFGALTGTVSDVVGPQTLTPSSTITLAPNTSYWLVLQPDNINTAFWSFTADAGNLDGNAMATLPQTRATSNDSGSNWSVNASPGSTLMIEINGMETPVSLQSVSVE